MDGASSFCKVVVFAGLGLGITLATGGIGAGLAASTGTAAAGAAITAGGGLAGGFFGNLVSGACQDWVRRKRKSKDWIHNHHLQLLVLRAMAAVIHKTGSQEKPPSTKLIGLADKIQRLDALDLKNPGGLKALWWKVSGQGEANLPDLEELDSLIQGAGHEYRGSSCISAESWHRVLVYLDIWLGGSYVSLIESKQELICDSLQRNFYSAFLDVAAHPDAKSQDAHRKLVLLMQDELLASVRKLSKTVGELADRLEQATAPPGRLPVPEDGGHDLKFSQLNPPIVVGRQREWQTLQSLLFGAKKTFRWASLTGAMGMGKSRLALELAREAESLGFEVIWYSPKAGPALDAPGYTSWSNWIPSRPTLLIMDDALDHPGQTSACLKMLADRPFKHDPSEEHPIRVLLLSREPHQPRSSSLKLQAASRWGCVWEGLKPEQHDRIQSLAHFHLDLAPLAVKDQKALLRQTGLSEPQVTSLLEALGDLKGVPLMALAAALTNRSDEGALTLEILASDLLDRQISSWKDAGLTDAHISLAFYATLAEGFEVSQTLLPPQVTGLLPLNPAQRAALTGGDSERLSPLLPHFLGSALLLFRLRGTACISQQRDQGSEVAEEAWEMVKWARDQKLDQTPLVRLLATFPVECWEGGLMERTRTIGFLDEEGRRAVLLALLNTKLRPEAQAWLKDELEGADGETLLGWMEPVSQEMRRWIVSKLRRLYDGCSAKPEVQEQYAQGLTTLTAEAEQRESREIVEGRLKALYEKRRENPGVQDAYATGLVNLTLKADLKERREIVEGPLKSLYKDHRDNREVQENYARGLVNLSAKADLKECREIVNGPLKALYEDHRENSGIQEHQAMGLFNLSNGVDVKECREVVEGALRSLYQDHKENPGVQEAYAKGLFNLSFGVDPKEPSEIVENPLKSLNMDHTEISGVQEHFAMGLTNQTIGADQPVRREIVEGPLKSLYEDHRENPGVQEAYARALFNLTIEADLKKRREIVKGPLKSLYEAQRDNREVQENYARGLFNLSNVVDLNERSELVEGPLKSLYEDHRENPQVHEQYAQGLFNLSARADLEERRDIIWGPLKSLYENLRKYPEVQTAYARGLFNLLNSVDQKERREIVEGSLKSLYEDHRENPGVQDAYAKGLANLTYLADQKERNEIVEGPLKSIYDNHRENAGVQEAYAKGLVNLSVKADLEEHREIVNGPLKSIYDHHMQNQDVQNGYAMGLLNLAGKADLFEAVPVVRELCSIPTWGHEIRSRGGEICSFLFEKFGSSAQGMVDLIQERLALPDGQLPAD